MEIQTKPCITLKGVEDIIEAPWHECNLLRDISAIHQYITIYTDNEAWWDIGDAVDRAAELNDPHVERYINDFKLIAKLRSLGFREEVLVQMY